MTQPHSSSTLLKYAELARTLHTAEKLLLQRRVAMMELEKFMVDEELRSADGRLQEADEAVNLVHQRLTCPAQRDPGK